MSGSNQFGRIQSNPKPEDFQINLADSQPSLDFDISGSVGTGLGSRLGKSNKQFNNNLNASKQSFKEKDDEGLSGSLDSKDFQMSGSYASMSRPGQGFDPSRGNINFQGRDRSSTTANTSKQREPKAQLYNYNANKFTNIAEDASQGDDIVDEVDVKGMGKK